MKEYMLTGKNEHEILSILNKGKYNRCHIPYIIEDKNGKIFNLCVNKIQKTGYDIKLLDFDTFEYCNTYNPLRYCNSYEDIDEIINIFIKVLYRSSSGIDKFQIDGMKILLSLCIALLIEAPLPVLTKENFKSIFCVPSEYKTGMVKDSHPESYSKIPEIIGEYIYTACFSSVFRILQLIEQKWTKGCGIEPYIMKSGQVSRLGDGRNNGVNISKLGVIFENLRSYEADRQHCNIDEIKEPYALKIWDSLNEYIIEQCFMSLSLHLSPFSYSNINNLKSNDNINLDSITESPFVIFIIPPDNQYDNDFENDIPIFLYTIFKTQLSKITNVKRGYEGISIRREMFNNPF